VKRLLLDAGRTDILTTATDRLFWGGVSTPELTGGADIDTPPTLTADFRVLIKGCSKTSLFPSASKTDGFGRHLFLTHPHTTPTQDTVFILLTAQLVVDPMGTVQILDRFGLRAGCEKKLQDHLACLQDP